MSTIKRTLLKCDRCGEIYDPEVEDTRTLRRFAKGEGWIYLPGESQGRDLCSGCPREYIRSFGKEEENHVLKYSN